MGGSGSTHGGDEKCTVTSAGKPEGKRPLGRPTGRWVYNIRMDLREIWWEGMD